MRDIDDLIEANKSSHYKLLTIVGNNQSKIRKIAKYLKEKGWTLYDVEEVVLKLVEDIPSDKIPVRIGKEIKKWIKGTEDKVILVTSNILYSKEMGKTGPFSAFKYHMRGNKQGILFLDAKLRGNKAIYSTPDKEDYNERELSDVVYERLENVKVKEN